MKARLIILALCLLTATSCLGFAWIFCPFLEDGTFSWDSTFFWEGGWQHFYEVYPEPGFYAFQNYNPKLTAYGDRLYSTTRYTFDTDYRPPEDMELLEGETYIRLFRNDNSEVNLIRVENGLSEGYSLNPCPYEGEGRSEIHSMLVMGDELLLLGETGEIIRYRPGEETARNLGETLESPYPLSWARGRPYINSMAIFNGELYGYLCRNVDAEGYFEDLLVRFEEDNGTFRAVEEIKIKRPAISYPLGWIGGRLIAADDTGFWIYDDYLLGLVHVLPDGTRQRWLPVPDFGIFCHYRLEDGKLYRVWESGPCRDEYEYYGTTRGHSRPVFGTWRPNELLFQTMNTTIIWILDLDAAPVLEVPDQWLVITANALNMRSGPGTQYENLGLIWQWDTALIVGETVVGDDIWYRVVTFAGEVCWLRSGRDGKVWVHVLPRGERPFFPRPCEG